MRAIRKARKRAIEGAALAMEAGLKAMGVASPAVLLLLGHMRSGSTLLLHLLLTNPEVAALGERGAVYASRADFARLAVAARIRRGPPLRALRYVADQINHDQLTPNASLLQDPRLKILFLLRRPQSSVSSIVELYRVHYSQPWPPSRAVDYYVGRLAALMRLAQSLPDPSSAALVRYEAVTQTPKETLEALRSFLSLRQGFSQTYATHSFTGRAGDPGPNIGIGRILGNRTAPHIELPQPELERAIRAYDECSSALARFALPA